jgi:hypothetical protein
MESSGFRFEKTTHDGEVQAKAQGARRSAMIRRARRRSEVPAPGLALLLSLTMSLVGVSGSIRPARGQSELGRGSGGSVPYPYGDSAGTGGRVSGFGNVASWGGSGSSNRSMINTNPYAVAALNPFLNPYASMTAPASPTNAALYFFAAQQSMGGIGSGQISGARPRPASATATAPAPAPSRSDRRVSDMPGSGAARYFNRGVVPRGGTPERHYNRYGNYYSANGH